MKRVLFRPQAARDLERLEDRDRDQVEDAIERFAQTGAGDVKRLVNEGRQLRLRVGDWRVRFSTKSPISSGFCTSGTAAKRTGAKAGGWLHLPVSAC
jgi:mRNA interferase RelE/StbE